MRTKLYIIAIAFLVALFSCSNSTSDITELLDEETQNDTDSSDNDTDESTDSDTADGTTDDSDDSTSLTVGYLVADGDSDNTYNLIEAVGYYHEAPDSSGVHASEHFQHIQQTWDDDLSKYVFSFFIHVSIDDDRGLESITDRQRNEIKTYNKSPETLVGQEGETMTFTWKFLLPDGFQTTTKFTHLHQLKGIDNKAGTADVSTPLITLTAYTTSKGGQELRLRYDDRTDGTSTLAKADLSDFLGQWVEVEEKATFGSDGAYSVTVTRISDSSVLLSYESDSMDMWRTDCAGLRPKWGIYRYLGEDRSWEDQLRDEEVRFADFLIVKE